MTILKRYHLTILLVALLISVIVFLFINIILLGESYLREEVYVKNLVLDMMCDIAESGDSKDAMIEAVSEIDTLKNRGVYCAAYDKGLNLISARSPLYDANLNLLDNRDLNRDVRLQNRGKATIAIEGNDEYRGHTMYVYFRWVFRDTDDAMLVILGMSQFAVETDYKEGLWVGAWMIAAASILIVCVSAIPIIKRKRGVA